MKYNFDEVINRRHTDSLKWDVAENELPMWVADMDFAPAPAIREAIVSKAADGIYGYTITSDEWSDAYINWWKNRHGLTMDKDHLIFSTGVVPTVSSVVRKLTTPAENILVLSPVYNIFYNSIRNNGRVILECALIYSRGSYSIDWDDLESKLSDRQTTMMILCNPHNPVGKIWSREELARIGELAAANHVIVVSDEIHCDIVEPGRQYVPFASVNDTCSRISITCIAPTKCFNMAGMQTSAVYVPDDGLYNKVWRGLNTDEVAEPNFFAVTAAVTAFNKCGDWLDELNQYISSNRKETEDYIREYIPQIKVVHSEATYLLWLDCTDVLSEQADTDSNTDKDRKNKIKASDSSDLAADIRLNIACPKATLQDGLNRLHQYFTEKSPALLKS